MKLVQRGPETMRLTVSPGTDLQLASRNGSVYTLRGYNSWVQITATASNCSGIQVMDRENGYNCEFRPSDKGVASYAGVFYASAYGPTVYVSDPTENTEVIMHVVPSPPPYFVERLRAWWGGCRGAKETKSTVRIRPGLVRRPLRWAGGATTAQLFGRNRNHPTVGLRLHSGLHLQAGIRRREHPHQWERHATGHYQINLGHLHIPSDLTTVGVGA